MRLTCEQALTNRWDRLIATPQPGADLRVPIRVARDRNAAVRQVGMLDQEPAGFPVLISEVVLFAVLQDLLERRILQLTLRVIAPVHITSEYHTKLAGHTPGQQRPRKAGPFKELADALPGFDRSMEPIDQVREMARRPHPLQIREYSELIPPPLRLLIEIRDGPSLAPARCFVLAEQADRQMNNHLFCFRKAILLLDRWRIRYHV